MARTSLVSLSLTLALASAVPAAAQQGDGTDVGMSVHVFKPAKVPATPERIQSLKAPPGFRVTAFATDLGNSRVIAVAPDGGVYVSRRETGDVILLKDKDGDGRGKMMRADSTGRGGFRGGQGGRAGRPPRDTTKPPQ